MKPLTKAEQRETDARKRVAAAWKVIETERLRRKPPRKVKPQPKEMA